jgi:MFS transporter, SP family, major inositol transporter
MAGEVQGRQSAGRSLRFVVAVASFAALGGLLFGYDTGVVSGALLFLTPQYHPVGAGGGRPAGRAVTDRESPGVRGDRLSTVAAQARHRRGRLASRRRV